MKITSYYARPSSYTSGGVNDSICGWLREWAGIGHDVTLAAALGGYAKPEADYGSARVMRVRHWGRGRATMVPQRPVRLVRDSDVIYLHEGWTLSNLIVGAACRRAGVPYVVMPHGVYDSKIVATLKTAPGRWRAERALLEGAALIHLFYDSEAPDVLKIAPRARTVACRTGFDRTQMGWEPDGERPYWAWLGRFDPLHKGIDLLLEAWSLIPERDRYLLKMVGPDYQGGRAATLELVRSLGLSDYVEVLDAIPNALTSAFVAKSQGFVHVPRWEALGRTVADAALLGVPMVISDTAHISAELASQSLATVVPLAPAAIADGVMSAALRTSRHDAEVRSRSAHELFGWAGAMACWSTEIESRLR